MIFVLGAQMPIKKLYKYFFIIIIIIFFDQITKNIAMKKSLELLEVVEILPFLNLVFVTNAGISFGIFSSLNISFYLGILSFVISLLLFKWLKESQNKIECLAISMIISGALGNGYDRIIDGYVIDFIDIHYNNFHWPSFNIADTSISLGVIIYFYQNLFSNKMQKK